MRKRTLTIGIAALALTATTAACSSSSNDSTPAGPASGSAAGDGTFPAKLATKFGEVTIPKKPTRVVALGWGDAETALALGVQPVGASDWLAFGGEGVGPWMKGKYTNPPKIIGTMEPSYEAIAALKPDLILDVKGSGEQQRYQKLSSIAPTVGVPQGADNYLTKGSQQMTMIATALGQQVEGEKLNKQVDDKFKAAAAAHPDWKGKTITAATKTSDGWGAYIKGSDRVSFFENLGFTQNATVGAMKPDATGFSVKLSAENLDSINSDLIVAFPIFIPTAQVIDDPAFKAVPAVAAGKSVVIDGDLSQAYSLGTTTATEYAIDALIPKVEKAIGK